MTLDFIYERWALIVFVLLSLLLVVFLYRMWRDRRAIYKLSRDSSGLWRYYKETQFHRQVAFERKLCKSARKCGELSDGDRDRYDDDDSGGSDPAAGVRKPLAVIRFDGDLRARQHNVLARLVDEIEVNKDELSEVVVVVNSPGGMVSQYGHAFAELERIRRLGLSLTVCIDVVAASGGYLMSLPATKIIAAPFAVVGSIGVVAFVPNIRGLLTSLKIEPRTFSAGELKRTVSLTGEDSPEQIKHFEEQLSTVHSLFLDAVRTYRPEADMERLETGDHWTAKESVGNGLGLVDEIGTSNEYLLKRNRRCDLVFLSQKRGLFEGGLGLVLSRLADEVETRLLRLSGKLPC